MLDKIITDRSLRVYNESCNNPTAGQQCADACDQAQLDCIDRCLLGDLGDAGSVSECVQNCGRDVYQCVDGCPCYSGCLHGCPCATWDCAGLTCKDINEEQSQICTSNCNDDQLGCVNGCNPFDVLVSE